MEEISRVIDERKKKTKEKKKDRDEPRVENARQFIALKHATLRATGRVIRRGGALWNASLFSFFFF